MQIRRGTTSSIQLSALEGSTAWMKKVRELGERLARIEAFADATLLLWFPCKTFSGANSSVRGSGTGDESLASP